MKKKIKDLTFEEAKAICAKHACKYCPLNIPYAGTCHCLALEQGERLHINQESEVEIDESNND